MREEAYLESVLEVLHEKIAGIDAKMAGNEKDIESMHQYFWKTIMSLTSMDTSFLTIPMR